MTRRAFRPVSERPAPRLRRLAAAAAAAAAAALGACSHVTEEDKNVQLESNAIDELQLNDIMLTVADADAAVEYFRKGLNQDPQRAEFQRGYAYSLMRAKRYGEARLAFRNLIDNGNATAADRVEYAHALARLDQWTDVSEQLAKLPSDYLTSRQMLIEGMLADHNKDWGAADAAYEKAKELSTQPAPIYNNWGVSKLARGETKGAEQAFEQALTYDPKMFSAKNNLTIAYGLQKQYRLPLVTLTDEERAILLHNLAVIALRQGDRGVAKGLLTEAVEISPRHFSAAADKLAALNGDV